MEYSKKIIGKKIRNERAKLKWSQEKLGDALGVSGKQISKYETGEVMPPMDMLMKLSEQFNCEIGFLLDEEKYSEGTQFLTAVKEKLGLDENTVGTITNITGTDKTCIEFGYHSDKHRMILNKFLSSPQFEQFYKSLECLDDMINLEKNRFSEIKAKYSIDDFEQAYSYYTSSAGYLTNPNEEILDDKYYKIMHEIDDAIDAQDYDLMIKVARYDLNESFIQLINSIYPNK